MSAVYELQLKPSETAQAVEDAIRSSVVPLVLGSPGMGKSDVIKQVVRQPSLLAWFQERYGTPKKKFQAVKLVDERVSTMDLTDWRGVPDIDQERKRTRWYAPDFLPEEKDGPTVVFLDEITQVQPQCQPPLYQLLLDGKIGTVYKAPAETKFVAAGNLMEDGTFVYRIGAALRNRMVVIYMRPDLDDWSRWAYEAGIEPVVIAFIRFRPELLYAFDKAAWASPTARGWEFVSRIVSNAKSTGAVRDALIAGKVGPGAMREFTAFERIFTMLPNVDAVLMNPGTADVPPVNKPELSYAMARALSMRATVSNLPAVVTYLDRMREEYGVFAMKTALRRDKKLEQSPAFTQWFLKHQQAMAA